MFLHVDPSEGGRLGSGCQDEIELASETSGLPPEDHCLLVQWTFNVSGDLFEDGHLYPGPLLNPDGHQIDSFYAFSGVPGAIGQVGTVFYPGGDPGGTLRFETGTDSAQTTHTVQVPPLEAMIPITFD